MTQKFMTISEMADLPPASNAELILTLRLQSFELERRRREIVGDKVAKLDPVLNRVEYQELVFEFALLETMLKTNRELIRDLEQARLSAII